MTVKIVADSTCDLPADVINRHGISVVPLYINVGNQGYLDGIEMTRSDFYEKLPGFPIHPTTAVPSIEKFRSVYELILNESDTQVLSIHISAALSAVVDVASLAVKEISSANVNVVDSKQLSLGTGFLVETAAKMAATGQSMAEILTVLNSQIKRSYVFAALDTLEYLRRSGRMNPFVANLGTLLQLKPILTMFDGKPGFERVRTREHAIQHLLGLLDRVGKFERLAILHANAPERVAELQKLIGNRLHGLEVMVAEITPVIGTHIGPGAFGLAVVGAQD